MDNILFHKIVADLVDRMRRIHSEDRSYIAAKLNITEQYIRKIHSFSTNKRYSLEHLYLLSIHWEMDISNFIPSVSNLKLLPRYQDYSEEELNNELEKIQKSILGEDNE